MSEDDENNDQEIYSIEKEEMNMESSQKVRVEAPSKKEAEQMFENAWKTDE